MDDFEVILADRIQAIRSANEKYDLENNAYLSFSGGKDSTILHYLLDLALPNNKIPRVFINTGIEYIYIYNFVKELSQKDDRFVLLKPTKQIKQVLETYGYPFKSKQHSHNLTIADTNRDSINKEIGKIELDKELINNVEYLESLPRGTKSIIKYVYGVRERKNQNGGELLSTSMVVCPKSLIYQITDGLPFKCSDKCCYKLKKEPAHKWQEENNKSITITGMRKEEGGNRNNLNCIVTNKEGKAIKFHPLSVVSEEWEEEFIKTNNIELCKLYLPPFNFKRTGCKGCPFALDLQEQLDIMEKLLPAERKQCEMIWQPVYKEYRRLNYRLLREKQLNLFED